MKTRISRKAIIFAAFLAVVAWAGYAPANPVSFKVPLSSAQSVPPIDSAGNGSADITYDPATRMVSWTITYSGLSGPATMAHFHGPAAPGKNAPVAMWLSKQGSAAEQPITGQATLTPEQAQQFANGEWYINVHTQAHPGGEIRGYVMPPKN